MFNYNVDIVINSTEMLSPTYTSATGVVDLYGIRYDKTKIKSIYKRNYTAPVAGGVQFPISDIKWDADSYYQIRIEVVASEYYQDGSFMGREQGYGKPFIVEFKTPSSDVADYGAALLALIKAEFDSRPDIWAVGSGVKTGVDPNAILSVQFANEYFAIKNGSISKLNEDTLKWKEVGTVIKSTNPSMIQVQGFGTYDFVLRNLRVPTYEALRFFAIEKDRRPLISDQYTQYTIIMEYPRNISGDSIIGENTSSETSHIYYVDTTKKTAFESMFDVGNANISIVTI